MFQKTIFSVEKMCYICAFLLLNLFTLQSQDCLDPDTLRTDCGTVFDLCIDYSSTEIDQPVYIYVTSNDDLGIFDPCDIALPEELDLLPKNGSVEQTLVGGTCVMKYTPNPGFTGLDSFDYVLNYNDVCVTETYCDGTDGKIWTINSIYLGPDGGKFKVFDKKSYQGGAGTPFAYSDPLNNGDFFFIDGSGNNKNTTEWIYEYYASGTEFSSPADEVIGVHTSCSALIFGVDFGLFRPISGCVAPWYDKENCAGVGSNLEKSGVSTYRAANEVSSETKDTTRVFVIITKSGPLAIDFGPIYGRAINSNNKINWEIIAVDGEKELILEKSYDGIDYKSLYSFKDLKTGSFDAIDYNVQHKITYYRFKSISFNGEITMTRPIAITNDDIDSDLDVFPIPSSSDINFDSDIKIQNVEIFDLSGRSIFRQTMDQYSFSMNIIDYDMYPGIYLANVKLENGKILTRKISIIQ